MWQPFVETWRNLNREQKVSVVLLSICGFLALGLSMYRVRANVFEPFLVDKNEILATKKIVGPTPEELQAKQKRTDTDGDGLSDWDEEHVYRTNPNLRDSCGDGITDNVRVITGKNLNCSANQPQPGMIRGVDEYATGTSAGRSGMDVFYADAVAAQQGLFNVASGQPPVQDASQGLPRDPQLIRQALKGKVDQAKLDALSDEELLKYYDEAIASQQAAQQSVDTPSSSPTP